MSTIKIVPLIVRSHYSLMWGVDSVDRICRSAREMGYTRLALTDTDNLYGLWPFLAACKRERIRPIVGAEVTDLGTSRRAVCLVEDKTGYANLCRLLSQRHIDKQFNLETSLPKYAGGLVVLTKDAGLLAAWREAGVVAVAVMPRRPLPIGHALRQTANRLGSPVVAAPGSFFVKPEGSAIHRILRAIDLNTSLSRLKPGDVAPPDAWFGPPCEYENRFVVCPESLDASEEIAERLTFQGPDFGVVMPPWKARDGRDAGSILQDAAYAGAHVRYGDELAEPIVDRLQYELGIIDKMGFSAYFLIVRDIVKKSSRTCGRGSGAASLVAYCLGITNVCPVKHNLYFERFLNPGRKDPPDIDVDFAWDERDGILESVFEKFAGHVAMVSNHVLFQPRMAVRETAKVYGLTDAEIGHVTKKLPWFWRAENSDGDLMSELKALPQAKALEFPDPWPEILTIARRIIGTPRYLSVHPGGIVITPNPINTYVPIENAPKGVPIIQWEKDAAEDAGLVKIDLLGNRSLGVIRDAIANIRANGIDFDENRWEPEDDIATQESVAQGMTMGCFYIESPAMRQLQKKTGVGDFEHLVIHSSIIRPAANEYIREYVRRLRGGEWDPIHPLLADVLNETFGIMVYQEDVSKAAVSMAGFSHAEADGLRKILSKKDREFRMGDYRERFFQGAAEKGVPEDKIQIVWNMIMSFSGYSFCKPHSASYARVSFQAAWLKVHYPAEFMAAVISNQGGFYSAFAYVSESRRMGLTVLPPDVNESESRWTGRRDIVRVGLISIKGLSAGTRDKIVSQRKNAPFRSMRDFFQRVRPDDTDARALIRCGALDAFSPNGNRAALMWTLSVLQKSKTKHIQTESLFDTEDETPPILPDEHPKERLRREYESLGFLCGRHPMTLYSESLLGQRIIRIADLWNHVGKHVRVAAWVVTGKMVRTKHGDTMEFLTFEDDTGIAETTFFPTAYRKFCHMIDHETPYLLSGKVEQDWGAITLTVAHVTKMRSVLSNHDT